MIIILLWFLVSVAADNYDNQCGFDKVIFTGFSDDFSAARAYCKSLGLNLLRIANKEQNKCITDETKRRNINNYWIDGSDIQTEGIWLNSDYSKLTYYNWYPNEPNNYGRNEHCIIISHYYNEKWFDDTCTKKYEIICVRNSNNKTILIIDNLEKDMTYEVKVQMDSFINGKENKNVPQYSKKKMFFTAQVNIKITDVRSYLYPSKKKLDILWSLEDAASGSVQSFLIRINNTMDTCLSSIIFDFQPSTDILKQTLESQHLVKRWHSLSKCTQFTKKNFTVHREDFSSTITSSGALDNHTLSIYGLDVLGIHKLYEKLLVQ